jgi:hypothetical protein
MQRQALILGLAAVAVLSSISGFAQEAQEKRTLEERVETLEKELADASATLTGLSEAAQAEAATLDAIARYLQQQARSAGEMVQTLSEAESQGFVAGINYPSRATLLAGWRAQLAALQKGVPGQKAEPAEAEARRGARGTRTPR